MEKSRKIKLMSIAALLFAIVALTLGFASFSKIMKISSSATVSLPTDENLKLTMYGFTSLDQLVEKPDFTKLSTDKTYGIDKNSVFVSDYYATIDNNNFTIDIDEVSFKEPGENYTYTILLKNDSNYGVYVYLSDESRASYSNGWRGTCTAEGELSEEIFNNICFKIHLSMAYTSSINKFLEGRYKLEAGEYMFLQFAVYYPSDAMRTDTPISISFDPLKIEFDTIPHVYAKTTSTEEDA